MYRLQHQLDQIDIRPMADHCDMFHHAERDWNLAADELTHRAREDRASWSTDDGERPAVIRVFFDGGVSSAEEKGQTPSWTWMATAGGRDASPQLDTVLRVAWPLHRTSAR